jgi:hypothetical protein
LVELLTFEKMSSLLTTCKEIYQAAEIILYYAPKVWENDHEVRKMFVAMTSQKRDFFLFFINSTCKLYKPTFLESFYLYAQFLFYGSSCFISR